MANPSVRGYQSQNLKALMNGCKMFVKNVAQPQLVAVLSRKAKEVVDYIDGNFKADSKDFPVHTANLHDATGVGVYVDGTIHRFIPTKRATKSQRCGFDGVNHRDIIGSEFLQQAITEASSRFAKGVWFVIFSAVPYAYYINASGSHHNTRIITESGERTYDSRGKNFFDKIVSLSVNDILAGLRAIPNVEVTATPTML